MKRISVLVLVPVLICSFLSGCGFWMNGDYLSVTPHKLANDQSGKVITEVSSYNQLRNILSINVSSCMEKIVVSTESFNDATVGFYAQTAIDYVMENTPVGAYAVKNINYEIGTNRGASAVVFNVLYRYPVTDILSMKVAGDSDEIMGLAIQTMEEQKESLLVRTDNYSETDFEKRVYDYIMIHGDRIVEMPEYTVSVYPEKGEKRIVKMEFDFNTDPRSIKNKKQLLKDAMGRIEGTVESQQVMDIYEGFYKYLSENTTYSSKQSDTPVYSLLCEQTGDSRAYAMTFAALCRRADLDCLVITGTYNNVQRYWNLVAFRGQYYHLDILSCQEAGEFVLNTSQEMSGYLWDQDAYPSI